MSEEQHGSDHAETDDAGHLHVDIEDAGGRELRDVDEKPPDDEVAEIEQERERRLDEENRPDSAAVDNTDRDFDSAAGMFTDSEDYEEGESTTYAGSDEED